MRKEQKFAFHSGIGDNDDLLVKQPESESQALSFQYAARMRGRKRHEVMIYPELRFNYGIKYKGDLYVEDNESPYKVSIDAYPGKKFEYQITETRRLPVERDYEIKMEIGGIVGGKTVEYRLKWAAAYQTSADIQSKSLFDARNRKGDYVGAGDDDVWQLSSNGAYVYETVNRTHFSGMIANEYYNKKDYSVKAKFRPILSTVDPYAGGHDDDLVCLIFRAKDKRNFYMAMWERHDRVQGSWRMGNNLEGANVFMGNDNGEWDRYMIKSRDYNGQWDTYVNETGWKNDHFRVYKVVDGKMYRVQVNNTKNHTGWKMLDNNYVEAICIGNTTELYITPAGQQRTKVFDVKTDWDTGSFGIANFSQAVEFHDIFFAEWSNINGATEWESYSGTTEITVHESSNEYVTPSIKAAVRAEIGSDPEAFKILAISSEVKDPTTGSCTAGWGWPVKVKTFSPPNAGQVVSAEFTKSGKVLVTPENTSRETALVVVDDVDRLFVNEIAQFKQNNPDVGSVEPIYALIKPVMTGDAQFSWDHERLTMWNSVPEVVVTTKQFENTIYAYQDWQTINDLSAFEGGNWVEYKLELFNNSGTINPEYDQIRWASTNSSLVTTNGNDVIRAKTTEWYKGIFPADIRNEGTVTNKQPASVQIPPMPEHYVEPYKGTPMPYFYEDVHYLLQKHPIGKPHVWMHWESNPSITTRNATQINPMTGEPIIKTNNMADHVVVQCDPDPRFIPWTSGQYIGYGKVNGKRPFMSEGLGKADLMDVPADVVFLPENLRNIQGPFIEVSDPRITYTYNALRKTITFSSDFKDKYEWYTDWATSWKEDPKSYTAYRDRAISITDPVILNPFEDPDYDHNVIIDRIEVISNNPFVGTWVKEMPGNTEGLLGSYYRSKQTMNIAKQAFTVDGNYRLREQIFEVNDAIEDTLQDGAPASETFLPVGGAIKGIIKAREELEVAVLSVPEGQSVLKIVGSFLVSGGNQYPDLNVIAPNGDQFGMRYNNGTWSASPIEVSDLESCSKYSFSGDVDGSEVMTFASPIAGEWRVIVFNSGLNDSPYAVTSNMEAVAPTWTLQYAPDPWSVVVKINGTSTAGFILNGDQLTITDPVSPTDVVRVEYTAGGVTVIGLPMRTSFEIQELADINIVSVEMDGTLIPNDPANGYTLNGKTFELHGSAAKPGIVKVRYSTGDVQNVFVLNHSVGQGVEVFVNGTKLDSTKYSIAGIILTIQKELLQPHDWVHIQSYIPGNEFDWSKENDLGEFQFSRIDPKIDFNWGAESPFETSGASFNTMAVVPDEINVDLNVDLDIVYPSLEAIDISNFTNEWTEWNEHPSERGDWHGPPEAGYPEVTNIVNQNYRSGWFNPAHAGFTDYSFSFKVQERNSGDNDMYGAIFRFDPATLNFYSFEWDATGMAVKGMAIYRNICTNPDQYGVAPLVYTKTKLAHRPEPWTYGASEVHEIKVVLIGKRIQVFTDGVLKFDIEDNDSDALSSGAWGPVTQSQPQTFFWDFNIIKMNKLTYLQDASLRHPIKLKLPVPVTDNERSKEILVKSEDMATEFAADVQNFLAANPEISQEDLFLNYVIRSDISDYPAYFNPGKVVETTDGAAKIYLMAVTKPETAPEVPEWDDYRESEQEYLEPDAPTDVPIPRQPEPYIPPLVPPEDNTPADGFAANWRGYIVAPVTGHYLIHATVDDGFRLWIDNKLVIDAWTLNSFIEYTGNVMLEAGKSYLLNANYFENAGSAAVKLEWTLPSGERQVIPSTAFRPYLGYQVMAQIKEATPLPWSPMIHNGYYYFQEREHYLYAEPIRHVKTPVDHQVLIHPRPQQGAPVIVRNNQGKELRKVTFYDSNWNMTLENTEQFAGNGSTRYHLQYRDIDPNTLKVRVNGKSISYQFDAAASFVQFNTSLGFDDIIEVRYKLLDSYMLDYNYDVVNDVARIVLHDNYKMSDMINMEIIYEASAVTPFYRASEIVFNPILNHNHRGFLFMTERTEDVVEQIYLHVSPETLPNDGLSPVTITARIKDMYGNPIEQKEIQIYRDGELIFTGKSNQAGEVYVMDRPIAPAGLISKYEAVCDGKSNVALLNYYQPNVSDRFFIEMQSSKAAILAGLDDETMIRMILRDEAWQPVSGRELIVSYEDTKGITRSVILTTGNDGSATFTMSGRNETQGLIAVQSKFDMGGEHASSFIYVKVIGG